MSIHTLPIKSESTYYHSMKWQLTMYFKLIGGCDSFTCVEEHV